MIIRRSKREIEKMWAAGRVVAETLQKMIDFVRPGVTTRELDDLAARVIRRHGAFPTFLGYRGFPANLCVSVNEEVVHGIPGDRVLLQGDIVSVDCGATLDGYVGDSAVTIAVGEVSPQIRRLLEVTEASLYAGIRAAVVGNRLYDISHAVQATIAPHGYGIVREYCGHGLGHLLHEEPQVPNIGTRRTGPRLKAGWCLAIEPMVNLGTHEVETLADAWTVVTRDRKASAHFEHSVAITDSGPLILTDRGAL